MPAGNGQTEGQAVELRARDAKRIALAAQGFTTARPSGRVDRRHFRRVLQQVGTVQLDSVNVLTRSHELIFFARLGAYDRNALTRWLWSSREVFEYWGHEASVHPAERHPHLRWRMDNDHAWGGIRETAATNQELCNAVLQAVQEHGPVTIGDLEHLHDDQRESKEWWGWSTTKRVVEHLFWTGEITATRQNGFTRAYLPPEHWIAAATLALTTPAKPEAQRELLLTAARSHGIGTARDLADYYRLPMKEATPLLDALVAEGALIPAEVDGWRQRAYLHPEAKIPRRRLRARALLSPFDSLIWERQRTERLWDFRYRIEIYVPAPKRVYGYYVLPFLLGEDLVARVDLKADRQAGVLRVRSAWPEEDTSPGDIELTAAELTQSLNEMADWLGLDGVEVEQQGTLASAVAAAVDGR